MDPGLPLIAETSGKSSTILEKQAPLDSDHMPREYYLSFKESSAIYKELSRILVLDLDFTSKPSRVHPKDGGYSGL